MTYFFEKAKSRRRGGGRSSAAAPTITATPGPKPPTQRSGDLHARRFGGGGGAHRSPSPPTTRFRDLIRQIVGPGDPRRTVRSLRSDLPRTSTRSPEAFVRCLGASTTTASTTQRSSSGGRSDAARGAPSGPRPAGPDPSTSRPPEKRGDVGAESGVTVAFGGPVWGASGTRGVPAVPAAAWRPTSIPHAETSPCSSATTGDRRSSTPHGAGSRSRRTFSFPGGERRLRGAPRATSRSPFRPRRRGGAARGPPARARDRDALVHGLARARVRSRDGRRNDAQASGGGPPTGAPRRKEIRTIPTTRTLLWAGRAAHGTRHACS